jgi:hypothetical protein
MIQFSIYIYMYMYILYLLYMYIWIRGGYPGTIGFNANTRCGIHLRKLPLFFTRHLHGKLMWQYDVTGWFFHCHIWLAGRCLTDEMLDLQLLLGVRWFRVTLPYYIFRGMSRNIRSQKQQIQPSFSMWKKHVQ